MALIYIYDVETSITRGLQCGGDLGRAEQGSECGYQCTVPRNVDEFAGFTREECNSAGRPLLCRP